MLLAVTGLNTSAVDPAGKFSFDLSSLHLEHREFLQTNPNFDAPFVSRNVGLNVQASYVSVYAIAQENNTQQLKAGLQSIGLAYGQSQGLVVAGYLPIQSLDEMARLPSLQYAYPSYAVKNAGATVSQADVVANVDLARSQFGVDGTGITIGVLSDSFNDLDGAIADSATGDLPPLNQITVLADDLSPFPFPINTDEGRGMMQLIHDLAPGADLAFHTAFVSPLDFALGIEELANEANADVIVDDVIWFNEPMFQDGFIARSVDQVVSQGVTYFSSAGNLADQSYAAPYNASRNFRPGAFDSEDFAPSFRGGTLHGTYFKAFVPEGGVLNLPMQWDQPYRSQTLPSGGITPGSLSDYDIYVFSEDFDPFEPDATGTIVGGSVMSNIFDPTASPPQFGTGDPYEQLFFVNDGAVSGNEFFIAVFKRFDPVTLNVSSTDVPLPIPNNGAEVDSDLVVLNPGGIAQNAIITDINVRLHIRHDFDSDLAVSLLSPAGTIIELFNGVGENGKNFGSPNFFMGLDDQATVPIADGVAPFLDFYIPAEALAEFDGESPYGIWKLLITDQDDHSDDINFLDNSGTLEGWSLQIRTNADPTPNANIIKIVDVTGGVPGYEGFPGIVGSSTVYGHANALGAQATGAVFYQNAPGVSGNPLVNEPFSSLGGTPIYFDTFGNRLPTTEVRLKPDISAPDGTNTTFFPGPRVGVPFLDFDVEGDGFPNFFGTSAAAPHAAAIAALMRQAVPDATPQEVYAAMQQSAIDMETFGHDFLSGHGYVLADEAIKALGTLRRGSIEGTKFIDRDGDGVRDADEQGLPGFTVFLDMNQNGVLDEISQSFSSIVLPQEIVDAFPILNTTTTMQFPATVYGIPTSQLTDLDVKLTIEHDAVQDLDVFLISPNGRRIQLFSDIGGNLDDFLGTTLDSEAPTSIAAGTAPYSGRYRPLESLVPLYSEDPNGIWWLEITDDTSFNKGVIHSFSLEIKYQEPTATTDSEGKYKFSNLTIGSYTLAELAQIGWQQTTYTGASSKPLLVTELDPGNTDGFEIQNVTDSVLNTQGWFVAISDAPFGTINEVNSVIWQLPDSIAPREVLYRTDSPSNNYFGANIFWNKNNTRIGSGWVMIVDNSGRVVDWAGWGWTPEDIASFEVTINGVHISGLNGSWAGAGADRTGVGTLQRTGNADTNTSGDFRWFNSPSMGEQNFLAGLVLPIQSSLDSQNIALIGNSLNVTGQDFGNQFIGAFPKVISAAPSDRVAPPISSVEFAFTEPMNIGSFSIADIVSFTGPGGNLLPALTGITALNGGTLFRVNFAAQVAEGNYSIVIGPNITAADDNATMDQDGDGIPNEVVDDRFTLNFVVGSAEIHGRKWNDINANAIQDFGEPGLANWTIYVDANNNGSLDSGEIFTTTDANGDYQFLLMPAGTHTIREVVQPGFVQTSPGGNGSHVVLLVGGAIVTGIDFGNRPTPAWSPAGASPIVEGQVEGIPNRPVAGAVHTVVAHPTNANILYIGAVNGGVWRTTNATSPSGPTWTPLTDELPSLSVGAMEMDPADPSRIVVGIGRFSSLGFDGGALTGLLLSNNGGDSWTPVGAVALDGRNISGVALRGATILASANNAVAGTAGLGGLYRSIDGGNTFTLVSGTNGLPTGNVTDLVGDPTNANRFYIAVTGATGGIFRSDDGGASWNNVTPLDSQINATTNNIEMAVNRSAGVVYVGIVNSGELVRFFRSATQGASWTPMDIPQTIEGGTPIGIQPNPKPGAQGARHFSVAADPLNPNVVYVGGDRQPDPLPNSIGAQNYTGRLFRGNAALPPGSQWTTITHSGTTTNSAPHADSREIVFDAAGNMIQTDDGGVYKRTNPTTSNGTWQSLNGNLQITEMHSVAYDRLSNVAIGGTQDVGTVEQASSGNLTWRTVNQGDGGVVAVDDSGATQSIRYSSAQFLRNFQRRTINSSNTVVDTEFVDLVVTGTGGLTLDLVDPPQFYTPFELNTINATRMVIGSSFDVYESFNRGDTLTRIDLPVFTTINTLAYGGRMNGADAPDVLYVGTDAGLYLRSVAGDPLVELIAYPGTSVIDIVLDPNSWTTAYVIDQSGVFVTTDGGNSWTTITGNLVDSQLRTIEVIPLSNVNLLLVGGNAGVHAMLTSTPGSWADFGGTSLPNAPVMDLEYDRYDDVLLVGTLGRGAWLLNDFSGTVQVPVPPLPGAVDSLAANLGAVTNQWVGNLNLALRGEAYKLTTTSSGILTVAPRFAPSAGDVRITVYDANMNVVATSTNGGRLDLPTTAGATYSISIEGTNTNVDVLLANVVEQIGSTVKVNGTAGDDVFYFTTGAMHRITVNGASYEYDPATVSSIIFDGAGGNDYAILTGSAQADLAQFGPGQGKLYGPGFLVDVRGTERIEVNSGGGVDSAVFEDSAGADTLVSAAAVSYMVGPGFANAAIGYQVVRATSTAGDDVAIMQDSAANDTFVSTPAVAAFYGPGMDHEARGFRTIRGRASSGNDTARMYDSAGNDTLVTRPEWTALQGVGFDHEARGFDVIRAQASSGDDVAIMLDSAGDDTFVSTVAWASLKGAGFDHEARGFRTIRGRASSGNDLAVLYDSAGNDTLVTRPEWTAFQGPGFDHEARGFDLIRARATAGGFDQAIMLDSAFDDSFVARPDAAQMSGPGFDHEARGFDSVRGIASTGHDRAVLVDSALDDRLVVRRDEALVQNATWLAWATKFDELTAHGANGGANTEDVDAAIGYLFNDRWS